MFGGLKNKASGAFNKAKAGAAEIPGIAKEGWQAAGRAKKYITNPTNMSEFMKGGVLKSGGIVGINLAARGLSAIAMPGLPPIPPGAMITSGKRGIDSNNLNSSGIGLSMYRNRRR